MITLEHYSSDFVIKIEILPEWKILKVRYEDTQGKYVEMVKVNNKYKNEVS